MNRIWMLCIGITVGLTCIDASAAAELTPRERFEREAPTAWAELRALASCVEGECASTTKDHLTGSVEAESRSTFRRNGLCGFTPLGPALWKGENEDYEFVIEDLGAGAWEVRQLVWKERQKAKQIAGGEIYYDKRDDGIGRSPWQRVLGYACRGLMIRATWLPRIVASPTFQVTEATDVRDERDGRKLVRIKFVNPAPRGVGMNYDSGEMTLDPARYWQIIKARINGRDSGDEVDEGPKEFDVVYTIENEYEVADDKLPYASRQNFRTQVRELVDRENNYVTKLKLGDRNDLKSYRLPAFGIAEPEPGQNVLK